MQLRDKNDDSTECTATSCRGNYITACYSGRISGTGFNPHKLSSGLPRERYKQCNVIVAQFSGGHVELMCLIVCLFCLLAGFCFIMKTILGSVLINQSGNFCLYLKGFRIIRAKEKTWYFKLRSQFVVHVLYFSVYFYLCNFNHSLFFLVLCT